MHSRKPKFIGKGKRVEPIADCN